MNKKIRKFLFILMIVLMLMNIVGNVVLASNSQVVNTIEMEEENTTWTDVGGAVVDGIVGLATILIRIPVLLILMAFQAIMTGIALLGGTTNLQGLLTPDDIFFNEIKLTDINFFNFSSGSSAVNTIRTQVATWYYIMRILAIVILLLILIYVGIRMAISTVASEKAQYKKMLVDWAVSFALIFLLNYIIIFTIEANDGFISILAGVSRVKIGEGVSNTLILQSIIGTATIAWGSLIVYGMLIGMTVAFLVTYIRRMLTIGFLIIISPLITVTYSIDKMGDGKAQALNIWLREFIFNVLIQPFHCIIYLVFVSSALDLLRLTSPSLPKMVLAILCMSFVHKAEKIVRQIFGFNQATSLGEVVASAIVVKEIGNVATKVGRAAGGAIKSTGFGRNIASKIPAPVKAPVRAVKNIVDKVPDKVKTGIKEYGIPAGMAIASASVEKGMNSSANAAQVGVEAFKASRALIIGNQGAPGSRQNIQIGENQLKKFAELMAKNTRSFSQFQDFQSNQTNKNNLKAYVQSLIGANMDMLNNDIQDALRDLRTADPTYYDASTATGMAHLRELQDLALDQNLDTKLASGDPLGRGGPLSAEEEAVIRNIQIRNLAQSAQNLNAQYTAGGSTTSNADIDNFIQNIT